MLYILAWSRIGIKTEEKERRVEKRSIFLVYTLYAYKIENTSVSLKHDIHFLDTNCPVGYSP